MTAARTETVVLSRLLSDLPAAEPQIQATVGGPLLRALGLIEPSANYRATLAAGFVEDMDTWAARVLLPADWAERLAYAACWSHVLLAAWAPHLEQRLAELRGA